MRWRSVVSLSQDVIHVLPDAVDPPHEMSTLCWCKPTAAILSREDHTHGLLVSHQEDDDDGD